MKIVKRDFANPAASITLWFIPTMTYTIQKLGGMQFNKYEWVWWVGIPALIALWFIINFKTVPTRQNDAE
jgi:hypothetical protein